MQQISRLSEMIDEARTPASVEYARRELGLMALVWDAKTNDEIGEHIEKAAEDNEARLTTAIYALLAGITPPSLYPIFLWVLRGFRQTGTQNQDTAGMIRRIFTELAKEHCVDLSN
jgi:hypothetical protein